LFYPGEFENSDQKKLFSQQFFHGGSVLSFICDFKVKQVKNNFSKLKSIKMAPSFGSVDSLIEIPSLMSHYDKTKKQLDEIGLENNLIRFSTGCEPIEYLLEDLSVLLNV